MLQQYFQDLFKTMKTGDATELSYYADLKKLIETCSQNKKIHATTLPKRTEGGNPDFRVWDGKAKIIGYIEAKDPKVKLDDIEDSEQIKRYKSTFPNLILTNFFEFRLYRNGLLIQKISIGRPFVLHELKIIPPIEHQAEFLELFEQFFSFSVPKTTTAKALAIELAKRTRFLRDNIVQEVAKENQMEGIQELEAFYEAFKKHLIPTLEKQTFADLFAQTITYGLFAARSRAEGEFTREMAYKHVPQTIGILRDVFKFVSAAELSEQIGWIIDDIAEVLATSNVQKIIQNFYKEGKGHDPIIHFYETFLATYDPKEREKRGVYYTPEPVVGYITRSIHKLLKEKFGKEDGFATPSVTVLDPAAGTLTFIAEAIRLAAEEYKNKYGDGGVKSLLEEHILKNFYAFELMMAPYAIGHLKIGFIFEEFGYSLGTGERFNLYLTNTLDFSKEDPNKFPGIFEKAIAKESQEALKVKEEIPIMVIMGNPPYSGISENKGKWILEKIADYRQIEGEPLGEHKDWLQDDYVKFIRFAQWKIDQSGVGILGFITNHAWLDNPTFRGMRHSLLQTFDEAYVLNLHGSNLKKEKTPKGGKDENVFDIQTGVAITIGIKYPNPEDKKIFYSDRWGLREEKYEWLENNDLGSTKWLELKPSDPYFFMVLRDEKGSNEYQTFSPVNEIFNTSSTGIVTARDEFVIDINKESLKSKIRTFIDPSHSDEYIKEFLRTVLGRKSINEVENYAWRVSRARQQLKDIGNLDKYIKPIFYRPFDERWIFYHPAVVWRTRENVMQHMLDKNIAIVLSRQLAGGSFNHVLVTDKLVESSYVSNKSREIGYVFPLFLTQDSESQGKLFEAEKAVIGQPNFSEKFKAYWDRLGPDFVTGAQYEDFFHYIYAILHSKIYRNKYKEFLKIDFPRIPFTKDYKLFQKLADLGEQLVNSHLFRADPADHRYATQFLGQGDDRIDKIEWRMNEIWINDDKRFAPVSKQAWEYYIGGYQVLNKWLKDRKSKTLSSENIKHYCKIVTVISSTIEAQKEIDKLYPEV